MIDLIQQNLILSIIVIIIPIIGGTWKIFEALFVKPRDFRIAVLEKNVDELRKEFQRSTSILPNSSISSTNETISTITTPPSEQEQSPTEVLHTHKIEMLMHEATLLNDLPAFYKAWKDKSLTELQRDQFEKNYIGQKIIWKAKLGDVSEDKNDGLIWVGLNSQNEEDWSVHAIAIFDSKYKEALLLINKKEIITISGIIERFSLSPLIKDCTITRNL